jgi:hypothetical protein
MFKPGRISLIFWMAMSALLPAQSPQTAGTIHIYRNRLSIRQTLHPQVSCDAFPVVSIQNGRVYTMKASAGRHVFSTSDDQPGLQVDIEPGKEYFIRIDYPPNAAYQVRASPVLVAPELGRMEIEKLRPLDAQYIQAATCGNP